MKTAARVRSEAAGQPADIFPSDFSSNVHDVRNAHLLFIVLLSTEIEKGSSLAGFRGSLYRQTDQEEEEKGVHTAGPSASRWRECTLTWPAVWAGAVHPSEMQQSMATLRLGRPDALGKTVPSREVPKSPSAAGPAPGPCRLRDTRRRASSRSEGLRVCTTGGVQVFWGPPQGTRSRHHTERRH